MGTVQGFGTDYRGWSDKHPDGSHTATRWVVALGLPVVPLSRDTLVVMRRTAGPGRLTTEYSILTREKVRAGEVARTYVMWWVVILLPMYAAVIVAILAPDAAAVVGLTGALVFAIGMAAGVFRHQRRLGVTISRS